MTQPKQNTLTTPEEMFSHTKEWQCLGAALQTQLYSFVYVFMHEALRTHRTKGRTKISELNQVVSPCRDPSLGLTDLQRKCPSFAGAEGAGRADKVTMKLANDLPSRKPLINQLACEGIHEVEVLSFERRKVWRKDAFRNSA
jgi:hypothetical protein